MFCFLETHLGVPKILTISRQLSMTIKDDYAEFLTFEDGELVDINAEALIENAE